MIGGAVRSFPARVARRVRALFQPDALESDLDEEMRLHIAMEAEEIARTTGVDPEEARRRALVAFGGVARFKEAHRDQRGVHLIEEVARNLRYAARGLRRSAGFTLSSVLVLALGIGSTTAVFSAVRAVLLDPNDERLAVIRFRGYASLSTVDYRAIEEQHRSFLAVGGLRRREAAYSAGGEPERLRTGAVTAGFLRAAGVRPAVGRALELADEAPGMPPVTVVSHALAARTLGGEDAALGRSVKIDDVPHTVIGVLPEGVSEVAGFRADLWPVLQLPPPTRRGPFGMFVIARLNPDATFEGADIDVREIGDRIFPLWSSGFQDRTARFEAVPYRTAILSNASKRLAVFGVAVGLVLLIAVSNVASLMLVRAIGRAREFSLRRVLGASRTRLVGLLVTESILLSTAGALAGIGLGALGLRALVVFGPPMPHMVSARLDLPAVAFAVVVALLAGTIVGAYPVARLVRDRGGVNVRSGQRTIGGGRQTRAVRSALVVTQFALALPLLAVAGLLLNSFVRLQRVDPGFDPRKILTVTVSLPSGRYAEDSLVASYWTQALPRLREVPGVVNAGLGTDMPPQNYGATDNFNLVDKPVPSGSPEPGSPWPSVDPDYFTALGIRLVEGRTFLPVDTGGPAPVALVSSAWARQYYPGESVIGKRMTRGGCTECPLTTVIGVVSDVRYSGLNAPMDAIYAPLSQGWSRDLNLFVRTSVPPMQLVDRVREVLRSVDAGIPLDDSAPMEARISTTIAQPRHWATLVSIFAAAALVLTAVGIFGMLSYAVNTRAREIGVRMALGARQRTVVGMVVRYGLTHALAGIAVGLAAALLGTRSVATMLFEVSPHDSATIAGVTGILFLVTLLASWLPARRAAAIDPVEAIRLD